MSAYQFLKSCALRIIPKRLLFKIEPVLRSFSGFIFHGKNHFCNVCESNLLRFETLENGELLCPFCGSLPRHRRLWILLQNELKPGIKILDFSPARSLYRKFKKSGTIKYVASDFCGEFLADKAYDISNINEPDNSFDLIICYHVLEHVEADIKAMKEMHRVLKNNGKAFIQTPFKTGEILEDGDVKTPQDRLALFGQEDHVRIYSVQGLNERLTAAGFQVEKLDFNGDSEEDAYLGLKKQETVLLAKKWLLLLATTTALFSCTFKIPNRNPPFYDETIHRQLWTADFSPDDQLIAVGGVDSLLRILDARTLEVRKSIPLNDWIHVAKWHPSGKTLAVATLKKYVLLVDIENGEVKKLNYEGGSRAMDWNSDGSLLAVADLDGDLQIWNQDGQLVKLVDNKYSPDAVGTGFISLDWHPHENLFVATNFAIHLFDAGGNELKTLEHPNPQAIMLCTAWHPTGAFFVIGDYGHNWEGENVPSLLHFWSKDGTLMRSVPGSKGEYRNIAWNKDGSRLATASEVLRIWDREGKQLYASSPDGANFLWGIDWNSNGSRIVTASQYQDVALWDSRAKLRLQKSTALAAPR